MRQLWPSARGSAIAGVVAAAVAGQALLAPEPYDGAARGAAHASSVTASVRPALHISQPIRIASEPDVILEAGTFHLAQVDAAGGDRGRAVAQALVANAGLAAFAGLDVVLDAPRLTIHTAARTSAAVPLRWQPGQLIAPPGDLTAPLGEALRRFPFNRLSIRQGIVNFVGGSGHVETLKNVDIDVIIANKRATLLTHGEVTFRGQRLKIDGSLASAADRSVPGELPLKMVIKGRFVEATLDGRVGFSDRLEIAGPAEVRSTAPQRWARWLGTPLPANAGFKHLRTQGQLKWSGSSLVFENAKVELDENSAIGTIGVGLAGARPSIEGTLAFKTLRLTPYLAEAGHRFPWSRQRFAASFWHDIRMPLASAVDADLRISSDAVELPSATLGRTAVTLTIRDSRLTADVAEIELFGGSGRGQLNANMGLTSPGFVLRGTLSNIEAGRLLQVVSSPPGLSGRADVTFDLSGSGMRLSEVVGGFSGKLALTMASGGRMGIDVHRLWSEAQKMPQREWRAGLGRDMAFDELWLRVNVLHGLAGLERAEVRGRDHGLIASGSYGIGDRRIQIRVHNGSSKPIVVPIGAQPAAGVPLAEATATTNGLPEMAGRLEFGEAAPVLVIDGTIDQPHIRVESAGLAAILLPR